MAPKHSPKSRKSKSKFSCFLSCFGRNVSDPAPKKLPRNIGRKKSPWSFWSWFRGGKSVRKTVPVDAAIVEDATRGQYGDEEIREEIEVVNVEVAAKNQIRAAGDPVSDQAVVDGARKAKHGGGKLPQHQETKPPDLSIPPKRDTSNKSLTLGRKTDSRKTGSQPGSPDPRPGGSALTSSLTFPPTGNGKQSRHVGTSRLANRKLTHSSGSNASTVKLDAVVGMSILMVALAFLLLWGRVCAIVCTSAWFYFIPRLRTAMDSVGSAGKGAMEVDIDSSEYKKKVIMAGFLERNRR
ncbi:uncharacterized protein At5g23160-like [Magnolia sinica]|uniref:uncharacterized protein At5g23160-like n=1 Tax=Magnolia sinica TaxID=86752 RepID=UPI00265A6380|nr:uncharacterized protein At5g23160-like [Magnolia sinica]